MIVFETPGTIDVRAFTTMGLLAKPDSTNPIGYFGTGLKYAIAVLVRLGAEPVVWIGRDEYRFTKEHDKFRDVDYDKLVMRARKRSWRNWRAIDLPYTTQYGRNWKAWQAFRELESNTRDEGGKTWRVGESYSDGMPASDDVPGGVDGMTRICVDLPEFDEVWAKRDEVFLPEAARTGSGVQVVAKPTSSIYWRGLKVYEMPKPGVATYNFLDHMQLTEDRTLANEWSANYALGAWLTKCEDEKIIETIITVDEDRWEHAVEYPSGMAPSAAFHRVMMRHPKRVNASAWGYYSRHDPRPTEKTYDPFEAHPLPWAIEGDRVVDAKKRTIFDAPYGYTGRWDLVAAAILKRINPAPEVEHDVSRIVALQGAPMPSKPNTKLCPRCGGTAEYPVVDIGVGEQQCGPAGCESCGWVEPTLPPLTTSDEEIPF